MADLATSGHPSELNGPSGCPSDLWQTWRRVVIPQSPRVHQGAPATYGRHGDEWSSLRAQRSIRVPQRLIADLATSGHPSEPEGPSGCPSDLWQTWRRVVIPQSPRVHQGAPATYGRPGDEWSSLRAQRSIRVPQRPMADLATSGHPSEPESPSGCPSDLWQTWRRVVIPQSPRVYQGDRATYGRPGDEWSSLRAQGSIRMPQRPMADLATSGHPSELKGPSGCPSDLWQTWRRVVIPQSSRVHQGAPATYGRPGDEWSSLRAQGSIRVPQRPMADLATSGHPSELKGLSGCPSDLWQTWRRVVRCEMPAAEQQVFVLWTHMAMDWNEPINSRPV
ncbi:hypothetical protein ACOMHN_026214 [Nucella lapillus]